MRLRNWIAVVVSVVLLLAAGGIALLVNRSALRAADTVHRADSAELGVNNATLAGSLQLLSAAELNDFAKDHTLDLGRGNKADRAALAAFVAKSTYFRYGVAVTDLTGTVLNATRTRGLPASDNPGYAPMRSLLLAGKPGFSSVMVVDGVALEAVAVPITVGGSPAAILIGFNDVAKAQLQRYTVSLNAAGHLTTIVDNAGRVGATSDPTKIGTVIDPAIVKALPATKGSRFVEYHVGRTPMVAYVVNGIMPGGWAYVRTQTKASFDGAVHTRSQTLNLTLLAMLLIGVVGISLLGYRTQIQRRRADERFQALFQHAPDMVAVLDGKGRISYSSPSAAAVLNFPVGATQGMSVFDLVHPDDRAGMQEQFGALLAEREAVMRLQCRVVNATGAFRWFEFTASNQMHNPALSGVVINARDVSDNKAFEQRLAHEAQHDALTGLPNRRRMQDALDSTLRTDAVAVLFVDLDGFKPVNDAHGHEAGDELLRQVAARLSSCVRHGDVLARVGGDEFVVLMPGITGQAHADAMSARVRAAVEAPFTVLGNSVVIGASVGVHLAGSTSDSDQALRAADHAMYAVKKAGGGRRSCSGPIVARAGRHRAEV
jgi:diguanylate cyclase (GGDEF)-like protein/PAS domain S-box-containing protein